MHSTVTEPRPAAHAHLPPRDRLRLADLHRAAELDAVPHSASDVWHGFRAAHRQIQIERLERVAEANREWAECCCEPSEVSL